MIRLKNARSTFLKRRWQANCSRRRVEFTALISLVAFSRFFKIDRQKNCYVLKITYIFDTCRYSLAAEPLVGYMYICHWKYPYTFAQSFAKYILSVMVK